jgi:hypothetical protein
MLYRYADPKLQELIDKETNGVCPVCEDNFRNDHSAYMPVWSEADDNYICYSCLRDYYNSNLEVSA